MNHREMEEQNIKITIPKKYLKIINKSMRRIHLPPTFAPELSREKFLILDTIFFYRYGRHHDFPESPDALAVLFQMSEEKVQQLIEELKEEKYIIMDEVEKVWYDSPSQERHQTFVSVYKLNFNKIFPEEVRKLYDQETGLKFIP